MKTLVLDINGLHNDTFKEVFIAEAREQGWTEEEIKNVTEGDDAFTKMVASCL